MADPKTQKPALDLPTTYRAQPLAASVVWKPGFAGRFINAKNAEYWYNEGLRPVTTANAALVLENPGAFQKTTDGTLRSGSQELWVEDVRNLAGRKQEKERLRVEQKRLTQAMDELQDVATANGVTLDVTTRAGIKFENTNLGNPAALSESSAEATADAPSEGAALPATAFANV